MGLPKPTPKSCFTIEQFLASERKSPDRHLYVDGEIYAMAGESEEHGIASFNIAGLIFGQLRGKPCQGRTKDTKVRSGPMLSAGQTTRGMFSYPDLVIICGEPEYHDSEKDVVLNPTVIVEVLSPSTELFDRGDKFSRYQTWNPTLQDYLLVAQDKIQIEHFSRKPDGSWSYFRHVGLAATLTIASIDCTLRLADVYERISLPEE